MRLRMGVLHKCLNHLMLIADRTAKEPPAKKRASTKMQQRTVTYINDKGEEITEVVSETAEEEKQPGGELAGIFNLREVFCVDDAHKH